MDTAQTDPQDLPPDTLATGYLDLVQRYRDTCPVCSARVARFVVDHQAAEVAYSVVCVAGRTTTV